MKKLISLIACYFFRATLWPRYKVTYKGLEHLNPKTLNKKGGTLFLPNHPTVFVDPVLVAHGILGKCFMMLRPIVVEYMYYMPLVSTIMNYMNGLPMPNFTESSNSMKKKRVDESFHKLVQGLKQGDNFLIYPAGKVKSNAKESVTAQGVHRILQEIPEPNIVLVRTKGLWGSSFSRAFGPEPVPMFATIFKGMKIVLKNLLFFTPRRHITIEYCPAPADFPYQGNRVEVNRYLEKWYNQPDGLSETTDPEPGDSLVLVPYSMWDKSVPALTPQQAAKSRPQETNLDNIAPIIKTKIIKKLATMTQLPENQMLPSKSLTADFGMDSLDLAELVAFLSTDFDVSNVPVAELTTVGKVMSLAAKEVEPTERPTEEVGMDKSWFKARDNKPARVFPGQTIPECFINACKSLGHQTVAGDGIAGIITYNQAILRVLIMAEAIRKLPGDQIGILLPASTVASLTVFACQLAGKVPVMVNWTIGTRHLEMVRSLSGVQTILSSWAFIDRIENVDFSPVEDMIVMLEDFRKQITLLDKLKGYLLSKKSTSAILEHFKSPHGTPHSRAVLLFTSGTENLPKGVPLSHSNLLSNITDILRLVDLTHSDSMLAILPPFHSFGFTICTILPYISGIRVAFFPDPTNGKGVGKAVEKWKASIICGSPTFLKGMFAATPIEKLSTLKLCVSGAEKAPMILYDIAAQIKGCILAEGYGITECSPVLTANLAGNPNLGVGKPLENVQIKIMDLETKNLLPQGSQGMIVARGPNVFSGYLNKGIAAPFTLINGEQWYVTGDLGYLDEEGNLHISGRLKRFVKIGGEMVSLAAVEETLINEIGKPTLEQEGPNLAICAKEDAGEKARMFLFSSTDVSLDDVNSTLRKSGFSNLVKVSKVWQIPMIPVLGSGKTDYRTLEAQIQAFENEELIAK